MYEKLVKRLRRYHDNRRTQTVFSEAADAIEELNKQVEKSEEIADIWRAAYHGLERRMYPKYSEPPKEEA